VGPKQEQSSYQSFAKRSSQYNATLANFYSSFQDSQALINQRSEEVSRRSKENVSKSRQKENFSIKSPLSHYAASGSIRNTIDSGNNSQFRMNKNDVDELRGSSQVKEESVLPSINKEKAISVAGAKNTVK